LTEPQFTASINVQWKRSFQHFLVIDGNEGPVPQRLANFGILLQNQLFFRQISAKILSKNSENLLILIRSQSRVAIVAFYQISLLQILRVIKFQGYSNMFFLFFY